MYSVGLNLVIMETFTVQRTQSASQKPTERNVQRIATILMIGQTNILYDDSLFTDSLNYVSLFIHVTSDIKCTSGNFKPDTVPSFNQVISLPALVQLC